MKNLRIATLAAALAVLAPMPANATSIGVITLLDGGTILQVSDALAGSTGGGQATSDTRSIYFFSPDFGDPPPNLHDFTGTTWPYVFTDGTLTVDASISASVTSFEGGTKSSSSDSRTVARRCRQSFVSDLPERLPFFPAGHLPFWQKPDQQIKGSSQ